MQEQSPCSLDTLGTMLGDRFEYLGNIQDLHSAISSFRKALTLLDQRDSNLSLFHLLHNMGNCLRYRFKVAGDLNDLEDAVSTFQKALEVSAEDENHTDRVTALADLALCLANSDECLGCEENREKIELKPIKVVCAYEFSLFGRDKLPKRTS